MRDRETGVELDVDNKYIMSPKDLKTIGFLDRMVAAGVRVFKIEGRARSAEYVDTVVRCYTEALASIVDGTYCPEDAEINFDTKIHVNHQAAKRLQRPRGVGGAAQFSRQGADASKQQFFIFSEMFFCVFVVKRAFAIAFAVCRILRGFFCDQIPVLLFLFHLIINNL